MRTSDGNDAESGDGDGDGDGSDSHASSGALSAVEEAVAAR